MYTTSSTTTYRTTTGTPVGGHAVIRGAPSMLGTPTLLGGPSLIGTTTMPGMTRLVHGPLMTRYPAMSTRSHFVTPMAPYVPVAPVMSYQMAPVAQMGLAPPLEKSQQNGVYRTESSLILNNVRCEGVIGISGNALVEAMNVFVGVAPFHLNQDTLEVTPEMCVVTRNSNIKAHLGNLPENKPLTLAEIRTMAGLSESDEVWLGIPGQPAGRAEEHNGVLTISAPNPQFKLL